MKSRISAAGMCLLAGLTMGASAGAQTHSTETRPVEEIRTFFLANTTEMADAQDIQTDLRNSVPNAHLYYVNAQHAISIHASAEDMAQAEKMIADLDRKRNVYRLTYSITEMDGAKPTGTRRVELVVPTSSKMVVKEGRRVPLVTGVSDQGTGKPSSQIQYIDVGLSIDAALEGAGDALRLKTTIEESRVADEKSEVGAPDPVIQQTKLEGMAMLTQGKPTVLGSLDLPGGARHEEISVVSELVK